MKKRYWISTGIVCGLLLLEEVAIAIVQMADSNLYEQHYTVFVWIAAALVVLWAGFQIFSVVLSARKHIQEKKQD